MIKLGTISVVLLFMPVWVRAADYNIERQPDGPFAFTLLGVTVNEGSTLTRESILFNDPTCPVKILSHTTRIIFKDRNFRFEAQTSIDVKNPIVAIQVSTLLYDIFGEHMKNLGNTEVKDFSPGQSRLDGEWRAYENDVGKFLTTITYVARVRLADGSQWIFNADNLLLALSSLNLEQKIGDDDEK